MKKSDIGVVGSIYGVCALFFALTLDLPEEAQTYPRCLIYALAALNTLYIVRAIISLRKEASIRNDFPEIFKDFLPKQFFFVVAGCIGYMVLLYVVGFYLASALYLVGSMLYLKVPKLHILASVSVLAVMVYAVFTLFLKVPLPLGLLFR